MKAENYPGNQSCRNSAGILDVFSKIARVYGAQLFHSEFIPTDSLFFHMAGLDLDPRTKHDDDVYPQVVQTRAAQNIIKLINNYSREFSGCCASSSFLSNISNSITNNPSPRPSH